MTEFKFLDTLRFVAGRFIYSFNKTKTSLSKNVPKLKGKKLKRGGFLKKARKRKTLRQERHGGFFFKKLFKA
jgi:hypothetical protein